MTQERPLRLGGYPAKRCPRVTHNDNDPSAPPPLQISDDLRRLFDEGIAFEAEINARLAAVLGDVAVLLEETEGEWGANVAATLAEMDRGTAVIVNGRLPSVDGRVGAPDVLVRVEGGYLPVDIKHHSTFGSQKRRTLTYSRLSRPADRLEAAGWSGDGGHRGEDCLQLAHYTRMLQALGRHPVSADDHDAPLWGGIIGTSDFTNLTGDEFGITWYDLAAPYEKTYSATGVGNRKVRSPVERYDHEFAFRVDVARAAREGRELVVPIGTAECWDCAWQEHCADIAGEDDPSFAFTVGRLDAREWLFLREHGGDTIDGLASLDADALLDEFAKHAVNKRQVVDRLRGAIERARMIRDGIDIEPIDDWPVIPCADVEIDFDIEWDTEGRIYQWGIRVREAQDESTAKYLPDLVSFEPLDDAAEELLANKAAAVLETVVQDAENAGKTVTAYHWHHVEVSRTRRFDAVAAVLEGRTFDLLKWVQRHFRVRGSYSIKDVATCFGFAWGVDDAGGFTSMQRIEEARSGDASADAARRWCLEYNEADVAAQAAIRDGLSRRSELDAS